MRLPLLFLITTVLGVMPLARVCAQQTPTPPAATGAASIQSATPRPAAAPPAVAQRDAARAGGAAQPVVAATSEHKGVPPPSRSSAHHRQPRHAAAAAVQTAQTAHGGAPPAETPGVLNLGATDITGNKELPKVMVIVPWKGSLGASGVIKPTDSLLDEVLQPVDRSVFQRRIRYYGQLNGARPPAASRVAPVGDTH
ncbi:MAG TPA: hypothetical protein VFX20_04165 [Steroidobacteraceae bacterium]|nr:hypothetical protein [Steroidobacteraceae bacterium]